MADSYTVSNAIERLPSMPAANVGGTERLVMLVAGAALLGYAWRNSSKGIGLASAGLLLRGASGYCPAYAAMGVNHADTKEALAGDRGIHIRESIVVHAAPDELYRFWRQLSRLPEVMPHLVGVEQLDTKRSKWTAKAFDTVPVSWEAEIINEVPFETIGWQTLHGEAIQHAGSVTFRPVEDRGTEVRIHLQYAAPGGRAASWLAWLAGQDPAKATREGLKALKRNFESPSAQSLRPQPASASAPIH